jgi:hypothetical protein
MKAIYYDAEGDILEVTFAEADKQRQTGVELSENIVLYYNPDTARPLKLILISYQALVQAGVQQPIVLDGLARAPVHVRASLTAMLQREPLASLLQFEVHNGGAPSSRLRAVFTPTALQTVTGA